MPDKKQNPLIGGVPRRRPPAPRQIPPAAGEKKGAEPVQITMDLKSAGTAPQAKPPEPSKGGRGPQAVSYCKGCSHSG